MKGIYKLGILLLIIIVGVAGFLFWHYDQAITNSKPVALDYKNLTYNIENQNITLVNGYSQMAAAPGSASKVTTQFFGNVALGDLNGDGTQDAAFLITQQTGGTGTFYYLAAALTVGGKPVPTNTLFLGDRIAPQNSQINSGVITVNYNDRKPGEPMTTAPSVGVSRFFEFKAGKLAEKTVTDEFGKALSFNIGDKITFSDGFTVRLEKIDDSRCKPNVVCVWAGELSPLFEASGGGVGNLTKEVQLGTARTREVMVNGYVIDLNDATLTTATITITKKFQVMGPCYVGGCSNEICSDQQGMMSSCIYRPQSACYKTATCARQASGKCGWTPSADLTKCLNDMSN